MRIAAALRRLSGIDWLKRARDGGAKAHRVPSRWVRAPAPVVGDRICLFVALSHRGRLLPHSVDHARAWHEAGCKVVIIVVTDALDAPVDLAAVEFAHGLMLRINSGYDFGAWAAAIRSLGRATKKLDMLALANDSVLGPSAGFKQTVARARASNADLIGLVESRQFRPHYQSFVLFFKGRALESRIFRRFWRSVRTGDRGYVIANYELMLLGRFTAAGLRTEALYRLPEDDSSNPTLSRWADLIGIGFPYLKVELLRDNPSDVALQDWRVTAAAAGFDVTRLDQQIEALRAVQPQSWLTQPHLLPTPVEVADGGDG